VVGVVEADLGYFGPSSITWRVHSEPVSMVGGLRALLLQALHPEAMQLMAAQSNFQDQTWVRLQHTISYVATVSFGSSCAVEAAATKVRDVHERLGVTDPEQLAWVHACLVDSFLAAARAAGLSIDGADGDRYVAEQARAAALVLVPDALTPHTEAALAGLMTAIRPRLALTPQAREAARLVLRPPLPVPRRFAVPARLGWTTLSSLAVALLPDWARRQYGLPPLPGSGLAVAGGMRAARRAVQVLPERYREGPLYRDAKARAAAS
jgi:uncharacterized protein (DUF2236 family)